MERLIKITQKVIETIDAEGVTPLERATVLDLLKTFTQFERASQIGEEMQSRPLVLPHAPQEETVAAGRG